jgi:hypothetical protein
MAHGRFLGLLLLALSSTYGCGGAPASGPEAPPAPTPSVDAPESPSEPATTPETPALDASGGDSKPAPGSEEKWAGEDEALKPTKPGTPVERTKEETRTTEVIRQTVLANRQPVRDCYDKGRKELGDLKGTMTIKFTLDPQGAVKSAELDLKNSDIRAPAIVNCSIDALKKIKFPPSSRGMDTTVNYPFDFKPDGGGGSSKKR